MNQKDELLSWSDDYDDIMKEEPDVTKLPDEYYELKNHDKLNFGGASREGLLGDVLDGSIFMGKDKEEFKKIIGGDSKASEGPFNFTNTEWDGFSEDVKKQITDELEVKDLQKESKMTDEGFVDKIEVLANKMGVNLDRDPEQVGWAITSMLADLLMLLFIPMLQNLTC